MKELFMKLLRALDTEGEVTGATLNKNGTYSYIEFENEDAIFTVSISKEEKKNED